MIRYNYRKINSKYTCIKDIKALNVNLFFNIDQSINYDIEKLRLLKKIFYNEMVKIYNFFYGGRKSTKFSRVRKKINIDIMLSENISCAFNNTIIINFSLLRCGLAPIAHELCHLMAYTPNTSLCEGVADYCQELFGSNHSLFNFGFDIHSLAGLLIYHLNNYDILLDIGLRRKSAFALKYNRIVFYIMSHSFVKYLVTEYGIEKFLLLYSCSGRHIDYIKIYGLTIDIIKEDWRLCIQKSSFLITKEDAIISISDLCKEKKMDVTLLNMILNKLINELYSESKISKEE